jgi:hypothetical protein
MRFNQVVAMSVVFLSLIAGSAHAQSAGAAVMLPGLWEITVQTRSPILGPPITHTVCIDQAHVARPEPPKSKKNDDCQVTPDAAAANETAYTVRCAKKKVTSTSRFTYSGDHFDGTVTINTAGALVAQVFTAKRVGDCDDPLQDLPTTSTAH